MKVARYRSIPLQAVDEAPLLNIWVGLAANFLSKMEHNISIGLRCRLFAGHSNTFSFNFAIFSSTSFDVCQGARSCWNVYADVFGNFSIDCVNSCCRTSQYNVPFIVPSKLLSFHQLICLSYHHPQCSFVEGNLVAAAHRLFSKFSLGFFVSERKRLIRR